MEWQERALCRGQATTNPLWWPPEHRESTLERIRREAAAILHCQRCPVIGACLATVGSHLPETSAGFVIGGRAWSHDDLIRIRRRISRVA